MAINGGNGPLYDQYDLVVIGSGPGGEVGAIRAAQLGLKVAIIEKRQHLGGTCLNVGCIPTKALLESAKTYDKLSGLGELGFEIGKAPKFKWNVIQDRKDTIVGQQRKGLLFLMKKNKIDHYHGFGSIRSKNAVEVQLHEGEKKTLTTKNVLIATGSIVRELPFAPSDGTHIHTSDTILGIDHVPESMVIVGGGIVGMEFASCFGRFGCDVTVVEMAPQVIPYEDAETVKEFVKHVKKQNVKLLTGAKLSKIEKTGKKKGVKVHIEGQDSIDAEIVLMSVGRAPVTSQIGLENISVQANDRGFIEVDEHYRSACDTVYAIGDVIPTPALAHTASAEAMHAVEVIAGHHPPVINYDANPSAVYTYPEIASIGSTEEKLKEQGIEYKSSKFPFAPMAKAKIEGATQGFIKILFDPKHREILGVHIINARATELIAEFALGKVLETTVDEIGHTIHPHPTLSETVMEAAHAAVGGAIHM